MAFQFLCPQGHLLVGEHSQVGEECLCPHCGVQFVVPEPVPTPPPDQPRGRCPAPPATVPAGFETPIYEEGTSPVEGAAAGTGPAVCDDAAFGDGSAEAGAGGFPLAGQGVVHILCPSRHVLETPREMLGEDALCPFCQVQFRLRYEDSLEYKREKAERAQQREQRIGRAWMHWSFAIAAVVIIGVVLLIVAAATR